MTFSNIDFDEPIIVPASSICESIFDGTHDSPKRQDYGFKLVTSRHIKANKVLSEEAYFINEEDYIKINKRSRLQIGDVLFTMIGTVGEVCRLSVEPDFAIKNIGVFRPAEASDSVWIYYYLLSPEGRKNIDAAKRGTTQQFMGLKELREFPVNFPKDSLYRHNQMQILELIDAKIDANYALSKTLEEIVQTIFKSWFIDFDPVKAKMAGEKPAGMDAATAALFPDSMVESELGLIPKSWEVVTLEHLAQISKKSINPQSNALTKFSHYSIPAFDSGLYPTYVVGEKILSGKFIVDRPSILVSKLNPQTQRIWTVPKPHNNAICSTEFIVLATLLEESFSFINQLVKSVRFQEAFVGMATGSTGSRQRVRPDEILQVPIVVPNMQIVRAFSEVTFQMIQEIDLMREQNQALINLRDALLPRLISGELQIPEEMLAL